MSNRLTLLLGGARAGKSSLAQRLADDHVGRVLFVATAEPLDDEMAARIQRHRDDRPAHWRTLEEPLDLAGVLSPPPDCDVLVLDCLTLWVSNLLMQNIDCDASVAAAELLSCFEIGNADWIVVSNEVGLGVVPDNLLGRRFADELGRVNQTIAAAAHNVALVTAGLPLWLKGADPSG